MRFGLLTKQRVFIQISARFGLIAVFQLAVMSGAYAYPEFQNFSENNSKKHVNCTMCHVNPNGPVGNEEGQIGTLTDAELERLNKARAAIEPGMDVDSPILNEFGNQIMKELGKKKVLEARNNPQSLAESLSKTSDLDDDGIADRQEYLDGTDALNPMHGDPWALFLNNLDKHKIHVILTIIAVLLLDYGLANIMKGLEQSARLKKRPQA